MAFKSCKIAAKWPQDGPRWPQHGPRCPQHGPRWPQHGPTWLQDGLRWPQDGPRWHQERSMAQNLQTVHAKRAFLDAQGPTFAEGPRETRIFGCIKPKLCRWSRRNEGGAKNDGGGGSGRGPPYNAFKCFHNGLICLTNA